MVFRQFVTNSNRNEAKKKKWKKIIMDDSKKTEIFHSPNSQYLFVKISEIGSWINRIDGKGIDVAQPMWSSGYQT
jgi:hypothetical protein